MFSQIKLWRLLGAGGLLVSIGGAAPGCGPSGSSLCDAKCQCEGCSVAAFDSCQAAADSDANFADRVGCGPLLDDLLSCQEATGFCKDGHKWETSCGLQNDRWQNCSHIK